MCGILGYANFTFDFESALNRIMHRGPDAAGDYWDAGCSVYLGHRRLSILDLSEAGRQPMAAENGRIIITFNGEIYNFRQLKQDHLRDVKFFSQSDTEVLLRLYAKYGLGAIEYLRGMFAFAIYDRTKKEIILCRDRVGIKPLYYYSKNSEFALASELDPLKMTPGIDLEIDPIALDHYFSIGYIPSPYSAYKYIRKLPPAHYLVYDVAHGKIKTLKRYWNLRAASRQVPSWTESEWIEAIKEKLKEAVQAHLVSDVPLGAFLSGGMDSSLVVSMMAGCGTNTIKTFTMGFENREFDERAYARSVATSYHTEHHEQTVNPDSFEIIAKLVRSFGEPFYDSSAIPTYYLSKMVSEKVKVILSGDGGDEVFAGYTSYLRMLRYGLLDRVPRALRGAVRKVAARLPFHIKGYGFLQRQGYDGIRRYYEMESIFNKTSKTRLYKEGFRYSLPKQADSYFENIFHAHDLAEEELVTQLQYIDFHAFLPEDVLTKVDRMSMLHSLETRVPLLDHELIELVFACPERIRVKGHHLKYIPKRILESELEPMVLAHKKQGFAVPLDQWFRTEWKERFRALFSEKDDDDVIDHRYALELLDVHQKRGRNFGSQLYSLLFYRMWRLQSG